MNFILVFSLEKEVRREGGEKRKERENSFFKYTGKRRKKEFQRYCNCQMCSRFLALSLKIVFNGMKMKINWKDLLLERDARERLLKCVSIRVRERGENERRKKLEVID
jgi:hypothetical protein